MVVVYGKPTGCFGCKFTKKRLEDRGIPFKEVDITTDSEAFEYVTKTLGYSQVPVVVTPAGDHWSGLNPDRIDALAVA